MDEMQFDRLSKFIATSGTRRNVNRLLAALPFVGAVSGLLEESVAGSKRQRRGDRDRHRDRQDARGQDVDIEKRKKKAVLCFNNETILAKKKKKKKLLKQGATLGECPAPPSPPAPPPPPTSCIPEARAATCANRCGNVTNNCGTAVACGGCAGGQSCCQGRCQTPDWNYRTQLGTGTSGTGNDQFNIPTGVAISPNGLTAWVADGFNDRISVWTRQSAGSANWTFSTKFGNEGSGDNQFDFPYGVDISTDELTIWVADSANNRVSVWKRDNTTSTVWEFNAKFGSVGTGDNEFSIPSDVAVSLDGLNVWVVDAGNSRISVWKRSGIDTTDWTFSTKFGSLGSDDNEFDNPRGVTISPDGLTAWVADTENDRVSVWKRSSAGSTDWAFSTRFGSEGAEAGQFRDPFAVAISADTLSAWIADTVNNRVAIWSRSSAGSTDWNQSTQLGTGSSGSGNDEFQTPVGVAVSPDGLTAWVVDASNHRVAIWENGTCPS